VAFNSQSAFAGRSLQELDEGRGQWREWRRY
jgi:hypothetical protein